MRDPFRCDGPTILNVSGGRTSGYMLRRTLDAHDGVLPPDVHAPVKRRCVCPGQRPRNGVHTLACIFARADEDAGRVLVPDDPARRPRLTAGAA